MTNNREQTETALTLADLARRWKVGRTTLWRILRSVDLKPFIEHPKRFCLDDVVRVEKAEAKHK